MGAFRDLTGNRFGRLTVISQTNQRSTDGCVMWECRCDCGKSIITRSHSLINGDTQSCGCYKMERISETSKKSNNLTIRNGIGIGVAANTGNEFYFDTEDFSIISRYTWTEKDGYLVAVVEDGRLIRMHRLLLGASDDTVIDHINQRRNDNRRSNLRFANKQQNGINRPCNKNNSLGVKGVHKKSVGKPYVANICKDGKSIYIGSFDTVDEAKAARQRKEIELFGEFAYKEEVIS